MPRLPGISQKEAVRLFQKLGYRVVRESGHLIMSNSAHRDAGQTPQEFRETALSQEADPMVSGEGDSSGVADRLLLGRTAALAV
jgi:hypothetical protein